MPAIPRGAIAVRGHGLAPTVGMKWKRFDRAITRDIQDLRSQLTRAQIDVEVYSCYRDKRRLYQGPIADFDPERAEGDL